MAKICLVSIFSFFLISTAFSQKRDTAAFYYKNGGAQASSIDDADYLRLIISPAENEKLYDVLEYYKDGHRKLIGKSEPGTVLLGLGGVSFDGVCLSFFPDGKRKSIENYTKGRLHGESIKYYPNGKLYYTVKYDNLEQGYYETCYDTTGANIAVNGTGHWIEYGDDFTYNTLQGEVKNGKKNGEWKGLFIGPDTIKYIYSFNNSILMSAKGYDKAGKAYPFYNELVFSTYK